MGWHKGELKSWMSRDQPLYHHLPAQRGPGVSIQGAITNMRPDFFYQLSESNDGHSYQKFIRKLVRSLPDPKRTVFIQDNMSYHHNKALKDELTAKGISLLFLPPSSSDLNPIGK